MVSEDPSVRQSEHRDIAHPITAECREMLQKRVLEAYEAEKGLAPKGKTGFVSHSSSEAGASEDEDIE
jgi:DNA-binding cell septation regulator SpoVG